MAPGGPWLSIRTSSAPTATFVSVQHKNTMFLIKNHPTNKNVTKWVAVVKGMASQWLLDQGYGHTGAGGLRVWPHIGCWIKGMATQGLLD